MKIMPMHEFSNRKVSINDFSQWQLKFGVICPSKNKKIHSLQIICNIHHKCQTCKSRCVLQLVQLNTDQMSKFLSVLFEDSPVQEVDDTGENVTKSHSQCNVYTRQALVELDVLRFKTLCQL